MLKIKSLAGVISNRLLFGFSACLIAVFCVNHVQAVIPGSRDFTFGSLGKVTPVTSAPNGVDINSVAVQPDGKVVVVGVDKFSVAGGDYNISVRRYNAVGMPDTSFGNNGVFIYDHVGQHEIGYNVALQSDGKIVVVAGGDRNWNTSNNVKGFKILRLLPNGGFDPTFGTNGFAFESFNVAVIPRSMFIQPDGKIVIAGTDYLSRILVARFNSDGSVDTGFGTNGAVIFNDFNDSELKIAQQADGKIVVLAFKNSNPNLLIRLNSDGSMDTGFGSNGQIEITFGNIYSFPQLAIQPDGKIFVSVNGGSGQQIPIIQRFNSDGTVDSNFNPNYGEILADRGCVNCTKSIVRILHLPDGRFYTVGNVIGYTNGIYSKPIISVTRYLENGAIDPSFGFRGTYFLLDSIGNPNDTQQWGAVSDATLQPNGKIVISTYKDVRRILVTEAPAPVRADFDGDRRTDPSVFRPSTGAWYYLKSTTNTLDGLFYGLGTDIPLPGDYNYDLKTDPSVYRTSNNTHYTNNSQPNDWYNGNAIFGMTGDIRVPADYDGDGYTDLAVFRPSNGTWIIRYSQQTPKPESSLQYLNTTIQFGQSGDVPVPADYDGDCRADLAVFRGGAWYILRSSDNAFVGLQFGLSQDKPIPADYDGDGKSDIAVFRDGNWYMLRSADNSFYGVTWGFGTDKPVPGDYDGDGKYDVAVYRPSEGAWYILNSANSSFRAEIFGKAEDLPIPYLYFK